MRETPKDLRTSPRSPDCRGRKSYCCCVDVLSDALRHTGARGTLFARTSLTPPWGLRFSPQHAVHVHVLTRGAAWLRTAGVPEPQELREYDVVLITGAGDYDLIDHPGSLTRPFDPATTEALTPHSVGRTRPGAATLLCGAYDITDVRSPLLQALPDTLVARGDHDHGDRLRRVLSLLDLELEQAPPGADLVADRLIDLVLVIALRTWLAQQRAPRGWWAALGDPVLGPALAALHADPAAPWTLADLAVHVATSRSALAQRFTTVLGQPAMTYLTHWRMTIARELLTDPGHSVESVAAAVGYTSPYAFSTAFRRHHLTSPRHWRQHLVGQGTTEASRERDPSGAGRLHDGSRGGPDGYTGGVAE